MSCFLFCTCLRAENPSFGGEVGGDGNEDGDCPAGTWGCQCLPGQACEPEFICVEGYCHDDHGQSGTGEGDGDDLATVPCEEESSLASPESEVIGEVEWVNASAGRRDVYWITHDGEFRRQWTLLPGERGKTEVSRDHYFLIAGEAGECLVIYRMTTAGITIRITQ